MTFVIQLEHFSTYAVILPIEDLDTTAPDVQVTVPQVDEIIQDGATLVAEVTDQSSIDSVLHRIRLPLPAAFPNNLICQRKWVMP